MASFSSLCGQFCSSQDDLCFGFSFLKGVEELHGLLSCKLSQSYLSPHAPSSVLKALPKLYFSWFSFSLLTLLYGAALGSGKVLGQIP